MMKRNVPGAWNVGGFFFCGWEERCWQYGISANEGGSEADRHRRLGKASGGFGAHCNGNGPDTVGAAGGVGGKVGMEARR